ncbi:hypothetical protein [Paenibacillus sp. sgz302251]|uniref:hypothetical protein n=1 Tax=Paenibacillus sp. sgz302251 TaxID=3414493 RepID=UPI003C7C8C0F
MLIEYDKATGVLLNATMGGVSYSELPETSGSCIVLDEQLSEEIWLSHTNGGQVIIAVDADGNFLSADIEAVTPKTPDIPKTDDQLRIEQLETELADVQLALAELFTI